MYSDLLRRRLVTQPSDVWVTDLTYIHGTVAWLRLCVEKVVHHRDDDGHALHQCHVGGVGQDGQSRCGARLHVAVDLATLQAKHLRDVREPHAVSVAVDEQHGRRGGLKLVGSEVVRFRGRGDDSLVRP